MTVLRETIEVGAPVADVYAQWTELEELPQLVGDVTAIEQLDDTHLRYTVRAGGRELTGEAEITTQVPEELFVFASTGSGPRASGVLRFEQSGVAGTRLDLELDLGPAGGASDFDAGTEKQIVERVRQDLASFKAAIERRAGKADGWHGAVAGGGVTPDAGDTGRQLADDGRVQEQARPALGGPAGRD